MSTGYYQKDKERFQKNACERYQNLSEEEKSKTRKHGCEQYRNLPEDEKRRLAEYGKNYSKMQKIKTGWLFY